MISILRQGILQAADELARGDISKSDTKHHNGDWE
jgi:hypothetical protein